MNNADKVQVSSSSHKLQEQGAQNTSADLRLLAKAFIELAVQELKEHGRPQKEEKIA